MLQRDRHVREAGSDASCSPKWVVNDGADGAFYAVIISIGTCGEPMMKMFPGMPVYQPEEKLEKPRQNGDKHEHEVDDKPHQDNGASTKAAWSSPDATEEAVRLKDGQCPHKNSNWPTQDDSVALPEMVDDVHGATVTTACGESA